MKDTASAGSGILTLASPPEEGAPAGAAPGRAAPAPGPGRGPAGERIRVQTVRPAARNSVSTAEPAVVSCQRLAAEAEAWPANGAPHSVQNLAPATAFVPHWAQKRTDIGDARDSNGNPTGSPAASNRWRSPPKIGGRTSRRIFSAGLDPPYASRHTTCFAWRPRMSEGVQILLVEDDSEKRCAAVRALARTGRAVIEAATGADALAVLRRGGDFIVLLALALPDMDGRDLLARIAADHPDTPAVIVTGVDDVAVAIDAMQRGAWDYVVARADGSHLVHLPHVVARTLERLQLVRDRNRYREEVEALAIALRGTTDGVVILDPVGRIAFVNRALAQAWRQPESAIVGRHLGDFVSMHGAQVDLGDVLAAIGARGRWSGEL